MPFCFTACCDCVSGGSPDHERFASISLRNNGLELRLEAVVPSNSLNSGRQKHLTLLLAAMLMICPQVSHKQRVGTNKSRYQLASKWARLGHRRVMLFCQQWPSFAIRWRRDRWFRLMMGRSGYRVGKLVSLFFCAATATMKVNQHGTPKRCQRSFPNRLARSKRVSGVIEFRTNKKLIDGRLKRGDLNLMMPQNGVFSKR